jgi:hypothetical protein
MKTITLGLVAALVSAVGLAGTAEARPGKGKAYGHYKHHNVQRYAAPRGYYAAPRSSYRRSNRNAAAAAVTGAIIGGALSAAAQPTYRASRPYRSYDAPSYRTYSSPTRRYYREEYYED